MEPLALITLSENGFDPCSRRGRSGGKSLYRSREHYGEKRMFLKETGKKGGAKIQDAHEAIRPTDITLTPCKLKDSLPRDQFRLYQLIWKRFTAKPHGSGRFMIRSV